MSEPLRAACYARFSTHHQSPTSIADQVRKCREFAARQGWQLLQEHIYADEAVSGTSDDRAGLRLCLEAATSPGRPFSILLIDDTSRLARDQISQLQIFQRLNYAGVRVVAVSQGVDTDHKQSRVLVSVHAMVDDLYVEELAEKTRRGLEGRMLKGLSTGSRCYGYRSVPVEDPAQLDSYGRPRIAGCRLVVEEEQAKIVRKIFQGYAGGRSHKGVAKDLNGEGVPPPSPYRGQRHPSWSPEAISWILRNDKYRGLIVWNKTVKVKNPNTGKKVHRPRDPSDWRMVEAPHLRIVSDVLWHRVEERLEFARKAFAKGGWARPHLRGFTSGYLLSGFLKCGTCQSNLVLVTNRGRDGVGKYGCPLHRYRDVCENSLLIRRDQIEREVLAGLQREVLQEEVIAYVVAAVERGVRARSASFQDERAGLKRRRDWLRRRISNLVAVISEGHRSPAVLAELSSREAELEALDQRLSSTDTPAIEIQLHQVEQFVRERLRDLRKLLQGDVPRAKAELSRHCREIVVNPLAGGAYTIAGDWDFLGESSALAGCSAATTSSGGR